MPYKIYHIYFSGENQYNMWTTKVTNVIGKKKACDPVTTEILVAIFNNKYLKSAVFHPSN